MTKRIKKYAQRLARAARRQATTTKKALRRLWRYHRYLLATQPAYRRQVRLTAAFLLDLTALPTALAALLLAVIDHYPVTTQPTWGLTTQPY